jgi:ketosteroid isomerase-like protein
MKIVAIALALAVAGAQEHPVPSPTEQVAIDRHALEALNAAWLNSYVTRDIATLSDILADDFVGIYSGRPRTKADLIAGLSGPRRILSVRAENLAVQVFGDTAMVTARSVLQARDGEQVTESRNDYADIYVRRSGRWRAVAAHVVRAPTATP